MEKNQTKNFNYLDIKKKKMYIEVQLTNTTLIIT